MSVVSAIHIDPGEIIVLHFLSFFAFYVDPGSGSMILQLLLGGVSGVYVIFRLFKQKILRMFGIRTEAAPAAASSLAEPLPPKTKITIGGLLRPMHTGPAGSGLPPRSRIVSRSRRLHRQAGRTDLSRCPSLRGGALAAVCRLWSGGGASIRRTASSHPRGRSSHSRIGIASSRRRHCAGARADSLRQLSVRVDLRHAARCGAVAIGNRRALAEAWMDTERRDRL